jgi:hypothetical protein
VYYQNIQDTHKKTLQFLNKLLDKTLMMEAARTSETSVNNYFTRQYIPEDKPEQLQTKDLNF